MGASVALRVPPREMVAFTEHVREGDRRGAGSALARAMALDDVTGQGGAATFPAHVAEDASPSAAPSEDGTCLSD